MTQCDDITPGSNCANAGELPQHHAATHGRTRAGVRARPGYCTCMTSFVMPELGKIDLRPAE